MCISVNTRDNATETLLVHLLVLRAWRSRVLSQPFCQVGQQEAHQSHRHRTGSRAPTKNNVLATLRQNMGDRVAIPSTSCQVRNLAGDDVCAPPKSNQCLSKRAPTRSGKQPTHDTARQFRSRRGASDDPCVIREHHRCFGEARTTTNLAPVITHGCTSSCWQPILLALNTNVETTLT